MEDLSEKIKLPSNWMTVNPDSIWRYLTAISKAGNTFNKEQLIKAGLYTSNDDNISRNLSYLKYLEIIEEERGKGKDQRFKVIDSKKVKDLLYELKANREDSAKKRLKEYLKEHILFTTLKSDFFKNDSLKTLNELEHFLKDGLPNKAPQYYQKGGEFLIKLLQLSGLAKLEGNDISLSLESEPTDLKELENDNGQSYKEPFEILPPEQIGKNTQIIKREPFQDIEIISQNSYFIQFTGPGMNSKLEIQEIDDFLIVEATLTKIKKKLTKDEIS